MGRRVTVAYESAARERAAERAARKRLKWHRAPGGGLTAKGERGEYCIVRQRPDRRHGIYRYGVTHAGHSIGSTDNLAQGKGLAAHHEFKQTCAHETPPALEERRGERRSDYRSQVVRFLRTLGQRDPEGYADRHSQDIERYELAGVEPNIAAAILDTSSIGHIDESQSSESKESPTRGEWEVIVKHAPTEHRGRILSMAGPGYGYAAGDKIILDGFYDDEEARHVANSISRTYRGTVVTFGPKRKMEAAEDSFGVAEENAPVLMWIEMGDSTAPEWQAGFGNNTYEISKVRRGRYRVIVVGPYEGRQRVRELGVHASVDAAKKVARADALAIEVMRPEDVEERRRPGAPPKDDEECEHGCPTGECKPFTKLERDSEKFKQCMTHAAQVGPIDNSRKLYDLIHKDIERRDREVFLVICIDFRGQTRGTVKHYAELSVGQRHRVAVDVEDILQTVILSGCDGFAVGHCHPSGHAEPSSADRALTRQIEKAAAAACPNVKMVDHIVVGLGQYYSFADKKLHKVR